MLLPTTYRKGQPLQALVENETVYGLESAQLSVFETHQQAEQVFLHFDYPVLASMIEGKKVMHLDGAAPFAFLPGESVMMPEDSRMVIDFPEASSHSPTKCLAMVIDPGFIQRTVDQLNFQHSKVDESSWTLYRSDFHYSQDPAVDQIVQRLLYLIIEDHPQKDLFVNMNLQELLIRIMQLESCAQHRAEADLRTNNNRLAHVINYIRNHLHDKLTVGQLSQRAYMSESSFYRTFKNEIGSTPLDFIQEERLKMASSLLRDTDRSIGMISDHCGFNSVSYFTRVFKRYFKASPSSYRQNKRLRRG